MTKPANIDEYLATISEPGRTIAQEIRNRVRQLAPDAEETISYGMPAFKTSQTFIYFAVFKNHVGIYPPVAAQSPLVEELKGWIGPKGNLKLPLNKDIPNELLDRVITALAEQYRN